MIPKQPLEFSRNDNDQKIPLMKGYSENEVTEDT